MGTRETDQPPLWIATSDLPTSPGHPFYARLTTLLDGHHFDRFVEGLCDRFYAPVMGRPSLAPGRYFRLLLVGYFEGIDSERGMAWRATDSLAVRSFLRLAVDEAPPDHSTIARTRRLIDLETHRAVFTWVQQRLVEAGRLTGKTIAIDATTLEANAAMRSIVRRDTGESYQAFLAGLATASGIETPTRADLARLDRKRKKKTSNKDWTNPHDPDAKVTKMKDGRTHLRGHTNILKRLLIHAGGFNLGLVMRHLIGIGTPRGLQGRVAAVRATLLVLMGVVRRRLTPISSSHRLIPAVRGRLTSLTTFAGNSSAAITCTTGC